MIIYSTGICHLKDLTWRKQIKIFSDNNQVPPFFCNESWPNKFQIGIFEGNLIFISEDIIWKKRAPKQSYLCALLKKNKLFCFIYLSG